MIPAPCSLLWPLLLVFIPRSGCTHLHTRSHALPHPHPRPRSHSHTRTHTHTHRFETARSAFRPLALRGFAAAPPFLKVKPFLPEQHTRGNDCAVLCAGGGDSPEEPEACLLCQLSCSLVSLQLVTVRRLRALCTGNSQDRPRVKNSDKQVLWKCTLKMTSPFRFMQISKGLFTGTECGDKTRSPHLLPWERDRKTSSDTCKVF